MAFNPDYDEGDIPEVIANIIVKGVLVLGSLITIFVLFLLYKMFTGQINSMDDLVKFLKQK